MPACASRRTVRSQWSEDGEHALLRHRAARRQDPAGRAGGAAGDDAAGPAAVQVWHWKDVRQFITSRRCRPRRIARARTRRLARRREQQGRPAADDPYETCSSREPDGRPIRDGRQAVPARRDVGAPVSRRVSRRRRHGQARQDHDEARCMRATLSPSGRYVPYTQDGQWWSHDVHRHASRISRGRSRAGFVNIEDDHPVARAPRVRSRRIHDGREVGDRVRSLRPVAGESRRHGAVRLTRGREDSTVYRCASEGGGFGGGRGGAAARAAHPAHSTARAARSTRPSRSSSRRPANRARRAATRRLTVGQPVERLVWLDKQVTRLEKAKNADVYLSEQQTFEESPNSLRRRSRAQRTPGRSRSTNAVPGRLRVGQAGA